MKALLLSLGAIFVLLIAFAATLTARYVPDRPSVAPASKVAIPAGAAERLARLLRIPTISNENPSAFDATAFGVMHASLRNAFPRVHAELDRETVAGYSLLYTWRGIDSSLKPILLVGHQDVVPVEPGTEGHWQHHPFSGDVADGYIWGRGAIDNKSAVVGTLEAVEWLLTEGVRPRRTIYLAFGHDEEVGGTNGARQIAALLQARGIYLQMVLDEGGVIGDGVLPGVTVPVALVGIAEKGFLTVELSTRTRGGHSSLPGRESAIGILSAAVARLDQQPMPARLDGPTRQLFDTVGPWFPLLQRAVFANLWATRELVVRKLQESPATNAMVRTTTAATIIEGGTKDNLLPSYARAVINFRLLPGDSTASVLAHVKRTVADSRVVIRAAGRFSAEPSAVSSIKSEGFEALARTIMRVFPDAVVAPYLVVVVTDARYYAMISDNVFRFLPLRLTSRDLERMHGIDERIGIREYEGAIRTYRQLLLEVAG